MIPELMDGLHSRMQISEARVRRIQPVVAGLVKTVVCAELPDPDPQLLDDTTRVLLHRIAHMPTHLSFGIISLVRLYDLYCRARGGGNEDRKLALFETWRTSPIGPMRDFVLFFEKMGTFIYFSHLEEAELPHEAVH